MTILDAYQKTQLVCQLCKGDKQATTNKHTDGRKIYECVSCGAVSLIDETPTDKRLKEFAEFAQGRMAMSPGGEYVTVHNSLDANNG